MHSTEVAYLRSTCRQDAVGPARESCPFEKEDSRKEWYGVRKIG